MIPSHSIWLPLLLLSPRQEELPKPFALHPCLRSPQEELRYLRCCARLLLLSLLPARHTRSPTLRLVLSEVIATKGERGQEGDFCCPGVMAGKDQGLVFLFVSIGHIICCF